MGSRSFMPIFASVQWSDALSISLVDALVGLTGVGEGSLTMPLLVLLFGLNPATAVGADPLFACLTKCTGTALHSFRGSSHRVPEKVLRPILATTLAIVGLRLVA